MWRPFDAEEADLCADSEATPTSGKVFLVPELKDESEASKDEQADSASENNVGSGALFVIGLHRSGDAIALFLQDWKVARVALRCHVALDMLCQELHDVERRRGWVRLLSASCFFWARRRRKRMTCPSGSRG